MNKVAIVVLADTETHEALGRVVNALTFAKELQEQGDEVKIVYDGAGTTWIPALEDKEHRAHKLYSSVKDNISGACKYCSKAFGVSDEIEKTDVPLLDDYDHHPSLRNYISEGYQIITF